MKNRIEFRVYLPHQVGQLALMCDTLSKQGVNIRTLAGIAAAAPLLAMVTDQEDKTREVLEDLKLDFSEEELLSIKISNSPGEIANFANLLAGAGVNIESIYLNAETGVGESEVSFTVDDSAKAKELLVPGTESSILSRKPKISVPDVKSLGFDYLISPLRARLQVLRGLCLVPFFSGADLRSLFVLPRPGT
jgi:hypothetical protein